jgi:hypothetical protein
VLAFEIWGYHQDQWLDLADQLLQTVKFSAA